MQASRTSDALRSAGAALVLVIAAVHLQQYVDSLNLVPTIGVLFLLNAAGGAAIAVALIVRDQTMRLLAAGGGIALALGSLVSILISMNGGLFGYEEPDFRTALVIAVAAELMAIPVLTLYLLGQRAAA
jgi:hypothetical protein